MALTPLLPGFLQSGGFWTLNNMLLLAGILLAILFALNGYTRSKEGRLRRKPAVPQGPQDNRLPAISAGVVFRDANSLPVMLPISWRNPSLSASTFGWPISWPIRVCRYSSQAQYSEP
jgi:hypothetical protein